MSPGPPHKTGQGGEWCSGRNARQGGQAHREGVGIDCAPVLRNKRSDSHLAEGKIQLREVECFSLGRAANEGQVGIQTRG